MRIVTTTQGFAKTAAIEAFVQDEINLAMDRFRDQIIAIDVFMKDINGPKGGIDKQVVIRARLRNRARIALETTHDNLYAATKQGIAKSKRAIRRSLRKSRRINRLSVRDALRDNYALGSSGG